MLFPTMVAHDPNPSDDSKKHFIKAAFKTSILRSAQHAKSLKIAPGLQKGHPHGYPHVPHVKGEPKNQS